MAAWNDNESVVSFSHQYKLVRIALRYRLRIISIHAGKHRKILAHNLATKLILLANRISPGYLKEYDRLTIERWLYNYDDDAE